MPRSVVELAKEMKKLQSEMEEALESIRDKSKFTLENSRVVFDAKLEQLHLSQKRSAIQQILHARFFVLLTAPVIYSVVIPFALLDVFVSLYQTICFPVYGIPKVRRRDYMVFDRRYLSYLNFIEKFNCAYCSYATGVIAYAEEVTSRTEQYWCPIKHARRVYGAHKRYLNFFDYGDSDAYRKARLDLREGLRKEGKEP